MNLSYDSYLFESPVQFRPYAAMAETKVKIELESEPSVFVNDETCPASLNAQLAYDPLWKRRQDNLLQQVEVEEQSLEIAVPQILELKWWLLKYADTVPSVNKKIESIGK